MKDKELWGNFDSALEQMIYRLQRAKTIPGLARFADDVLKEWDNNRGTDWFTSTRRNKQDG